MGDISSKQCIDALQGSNLITSTQSQSSGKNNIVVVNPEIHLHSNSNSGSNNTSGSMKYDRRIKELEEELKLKQDQIELERGLRLLEERERRADNIRAKKLLIEKENQFQDQNDLLSWHADVLKEKNACWGEKTYPAFLYGQSEKRIRMDHGTGNGSHLAKKKRKNKNKSKRSYNVNRSLTNNSNRNAHNYDSQRTRSKTEINYRNGPMEFWEWNGTKWVMKKLNDSVKIGDPKSSEDSNAPQNQSSIRTNVSSIGKACDTGYPSQNLQIVVPPASEMCGAEPSVGPLQTDVTVANEMCDNDKLATNSQLAVKEYEGSAEASTSVHCLDDTVDKCLDLTNLSRTHVRLTDLSFPSVVSISFDEREINRLMGHDAALLAMPKESRQPK